MIRLAFRARQAKPQRAPAYPGSPATIAGCQTYRGRNDLVTITENHHPQKSELSTKLPAPDHFKSLNYILLTRYVNTGNTLLRTMIAATRKWLRRNRTPFAIGFGVLGVGYVATQYVMGKISDARQRMSSDRIAREKYMSLS